MMKLTAFEKRQCSPADVVVTGKIVKRLNPPIIIHRGIPRPKRLSEEERSRRAEIVRQAARKFSGTVKLASHLGTNYTNVSKWANEINPVPDKYMPELTRIVLPNTHMDS